MNLNRELFTSEQPVRNSGLKDPNFTDSKAGINPAEKRSMSIRKPTRSLMLIFGVFVAMTAVVLYLQSINVEIPLPVKGAKALVSIIDKAESAIRFISKFLPERQL